MSKIVINNEFDERILNQNRNNPTLLSKLSNLEQSIVICEQKFLDNRSVIWLVYCTWGGGQIYYKGKL